MLIYLLILFIIVIANCKLADYDVIDLSDILNADYMPGSLLVLENSEENVVFKNDTKDSSRFEFHGNFDDAFATMGYHRKMMNEYLCRGYVSEQIISEMRSSRIRRRLGNPAENTDKVGTMPSKINLSIKNNMLDDEGSSNYQEWLKKSATLEDIYRHYDTAQNREAPENGRDAGDEVNEEYEGHVTGYGYQQPQAPASPSKLGHSGTGAGYPYHSFPSAGTHSAGGGVGPGLYGGHSGYGTGGSYFGGQVDHMMINEGGGGHSGHGGHYSSGHENTPKYHSSHDDKGKLADLFDIALTALAFLSFGMFIIQVIMCISMTTTTTAPAMTMMPMSMSPTGVDPTGGMTGDGMMGGGGTGNGGNTNDGGTTGGDNDGAGNGGGSSTAPGTGEGSNGGGTTGGGDGGATDGDGGATGDGGDGGTTGGDGGAADGDGDGATTGGDGGATDGDGDGGATDGDSGTTGGDGGATGGDGGTTGGDGGDGGATAGDGDGDDGTGGDGGRMGGTTYGQEGAITAGGSTGTGTGGTGGGTATGGMATGETSATGGGRDTASFRIKRDIPTIAQPNNEALNELARRILISIEAALVVHQDDGNCLRKTLCENNLYSRNLQSNQKYWIPVWSLGMSWLSGRLVKGLSTTSMLDSLKASLLGLGNADCEMLYNDCDLSKERQKRRRKRRKRSTF